MMLPEMLLSSSPGTPGTPRTPPQEIADPIAEHQAITIASLNACATEFIPTQSMSCPLVGICEVIVEGDESQDQPSTELRFTSTRSLLPIQPFLSNTSKARGKQFWRKPKPSTLVVQPRVPQPIAAEVLSEEQIDRRVRSIEVCKTSKEYSFHVEQGKLLGLGSEEERLTPDPRDSGISKRRWVRAVQDWRDELQRRYFLEMERSEGGSRPGPEAASVASTEAEEAQSSEAGDSTTDDASSAHWSSR